MSRITFKQNDKVFQYATEAVSLYNPGTTSLSGDNIFKFSRIVYVLGDLIAIQGFSENDDHKRGLIKQGLARYSHYQRKSPNLLKKALATEITRREKQTPSKFFVVFPLNISYSTLKAKRYFTVGKMKLKTRSLLHVRSKFDFRESYDMLRQSGNRIEGDISDFTYIIAEMEAKDSTDAFRAAYQRIGLFRSLCNFTLSYGRIFYQYGHASPLGEINPPKYMFVFDHDGKYVNYWFSLGEFQYRLLRLQNNELDSISKTLKDFEALNPNSLRNILTNCLTVYGYALDEIEPGYIFLNMWQILELIALKDQSGITLEKVRNRIKAIYKNKPIVSATLDALFCKRNRLVHEGQLASFSLEDVNQIKGIAESCMNFLFSQVNRLKTTSALQDFYENIGQSSEDIDKKIGILRYVKKVKKN